MKKITENILIVGAGGAASYLLPALTKIADPEAITIYDGDKVEERNLDRQLFPKSAVGKNKAEQLAKLFNTQHAPLYLTPLNLPSQLYKWAIALPDNHPARLTVLTMVDIGQVAFAIIGGNETFDNQAMIYRKEWRDTELDPRVRYPELLTDTSGDPTSCQDLSQPGGAQTPVANMGAAHKALSLLITWNRTDTGEFTPVEISQNTYATETLQQGA